MEPGPPAVDVDLAFVAAVRMHTGQQLDQRRLARPVLAAERVYLARSQVEAHATERRHRAEALHDRVCFEDDAFTHGRGGRCASGVPRYTSS